MTGKQSAIVMEHKDVPGSEAIYLTIDSCRVLFRGIQREGGGHPYHIIYQTLITNPQSQPRPLKAHYILY